MNDIFQSTISLGDLIQIAIAATILLIAFTAWSIHQWRLNHPFHLTFSEDPYIIPEEAFYREGYHRRRKESGTFYEIWTTQKTFEILLRVMPNKGTRIDRIGVRFVQRRLTWEFRRWWLLARPRIWDWDNVPQRNIKIVSLKDMEVATGDNPAGQQFETWHDRAGGFWGQYTPPYARAIEDSLWLKVVADVSYPGDYHLSFQGRITDERRGYARRHVKIADVRTQNGAQEADN